VKKKGIGNRIAAVTNERFFCAAALGRELGEKGKEWLQHQNPFAFPHSIC
jgi:hypothetical protein